MAGSSETGDLGEWRGFTGKNNKLRVAGCGLKELHVQPEHHVTYCFIFFNTEIQRTQSFTETLCFPYAAVGLMTNSTNIRGQPFKSRSKLFVGHKTNKAAIVPFVACSL